MQSEEKCWISMSAIAFLAFAGAAMGLSSRDALPGESAIFAGTLAIAVIGMAVAAIRYVRLRQALARRGVF